MNPIFGYQASTELNNDSWATLVSASKGVPKDDLAPTFQKWEHEFKEETKQPLPGAWRSAKSVIIGAMKNDVPLTDGTNIRGKTAVEKAIRESKEHRTPKAVTEAVVIKAWCDLYKMASESGHLRALGATVAGAVFR